MTHTRNDGNTSAKEIPLTKGMSAIVDETDYAALSQYNWYTRSHRGLQYAGRNIKVGSCQRTVLMHREIFGLTDPRISVDHINHNTLDNRRKNLRICTHRENMHNVILTKKKTSKYIGVNLMSDRPRYRAEIQVFGQHFHLGVFETEEEAHAIYCGAVESNKDILAMRSLEEYYAST